MPPRQENCKQYYIQNPYIQAQQTHHTIRSPVYVRALIRATSALGLAQSLFVLRFFLEIDDVQFDHYYSGLLNSSLYYRFPMRESDNLLCLSEPYTMALVMSLGYVCGVQQ